MSDAPPPQRPPRRPPGPGGGDGGTPAAGTPERRTPSRPSVPRPQMRIPDPAPDPPTPQQHEIGRRTFLVADVDPLDVDGVRTLTIGCAIWAIAIVALLPFYGRLRDDGNLWWLWTCVAGFGLGLYGLEYCRRRRRARLERDDEEPEG